ncbi:MAG: hypothetical protein QM541_10175 [Flavobacterium sp.]|nr:hypothetical protein [Flavobacterium sp.]
MRLKYLIVFLLLSFSSIAQQKHYSQPKGIFRASITVPIGISVNVSYELKLKKNLTLVPQASLFSYFKIRGEYIGSPSYTNYQSPSLLASIFSAELRYYFNLNRRTAKNKNVTNYSAGYIGLQPYTASNPFNGDDNYALDYEGNNGAFFNLGVQKQFHKHFYYNLYAGALIGSRSFKGSYAANVDPAHVGLTLGYTF